MKYVSENAMPQVVYFQLCFRTFNQMFLQPEDRSIKF